MWIKFYADKEKVEKAIGVMEEYLAILNERAEVLRKTKGLTDDEHDLFQIEAKTANRVYQVLEDFKWSVNGGDTEATENEQLSQISEFLKQEVGQHTRYSYYDHKDMVKALKGFFTDLIAEKQKAYGTFATLADDQRIKLLAVKFLLEQATYASTHRAKDARIQQIQETITTIVENLGRIDKNDPQSYSWQMRSNVGDWSYIQTLRDMHYQQVELENLRKENEELRQANQKLSGENAQAIVDMKVEDFVEDEIPFD